MKKRPLTKAIGLLASGLALSTIGTSNALALSSVDYNNYGAYASNINTDEAGNGTDGWHSDEDTSWGSGSRPFGTTTPVANWAAHIETGGDSLIVSSANAKATYDFWADIDTAKGAWSDGVEGWGHNTDIGLFKSDVDTDVTLYFTSLQPAGSSETWTNFGISVFSGMSAGSWNHHGGWNYTSSSSFTDNNPLGSSGLTYVTHDATVDSVNGVTFHAYANQVYSILIGGNSGGTNYDPHAGYAVSISTTAAPVPVPGAAWLFGGAIASLISANRRKRIVPA